MGTIGEISGPGGATGLGAYLLVAGGLLAVVGVLAAWRDARSRGWPSVEGTVRRAWLESDEGESVEVEVAYHVDGRSFTREETVVERTSVRATREEALRRLRPGTPVVVHHHPTRPHVSRLRTGLRWPALLFVAVGVGLAVVGLALLAG